MTRFLCSLLLLVPLAAQAQINLPDVIEPYKPIIAGCDCVTPPNGSVQFVWRSDVNTEYRPIGEGKTVHAWAAPGPHWFDVVVVTQTFSERTVFVPDPDNPNDLTKAKVEKIKVQETLTVDRFEKRFTVSGSPPPKPEPDPEPKPEPDPTPDPAPTTEFAKKCQEWFKAIKPAGVYKRETALKIADNYRAVAAQAAATSGWDLAAFVQKTKELNGPTVSNAQLNWGEAFFKPLAEYQSKLFEERKLNTKDVRGIAQLWNDTADAISAAAY